MKNPIQFVDKIMALIQQHITDAGLWRSLQNYFFRSQVKNIQNNFVTLADNSQAKILNNGSFEVGDRVFVLKVGSGQQFVFFPFLEDFEVAEEEVERVLQLLLFIEGRGSITIQGNQPNFSYQYSTKEFKPDALVVKKDRIENILGIEEESIEDALIISHEGAERMEHTSQITVFASLPPEPTEPLQLNLVADTLNEEALRDEVRVIGWEGNGENVGGWEDRRGKQWFFVEWQFGKIDPETEKILFVESNPNPQLTGSLDKENLENVILKALFRFAVEIASYFYAGEAFFSISSCFTDTAGSVTEPFAIHVIPLVSNPLSRHLYQTGIIKDPLTEDYVTFEDWFKANHGINDFSALIEKLKDLPSNIIPLPPKFWDEQTTDVNEINNWIVANIESQFGWVAAAEMTIEGSYGDNVSYQEIKINRAANMTIKKNDFDFSPWWWRGIEGFNQMLEIQATGLTWHPRHQMWYDASISVPKPSDDLWVSSFRVIIEYKLLHVFYPSRLRKDLGSVDLRQRSINYDPKNLLEHYRTWFSPNIFLSEGRDGFNFYLFSRATLYFFISPFWTLEKIWHTSSPRRTKYLGLDEPWEINYPTSTLWGPLRHFHHNGAISATGSYTLLPSKSHESVTATYENIYFRRPLSINEPIRSSYNVSAHFFSREFQKKASGANFVCPYNAISDFTEETGMNVTISLECVIGVPAVIPADMFLGTLTFTNSIGAGNTVRYMFSGTYTVPSPWGDLGLVYFWGHPPIWSSSSSNARSGVAITVKKHVPVPMYLLDVHFGLFGAIPDLINWTFSK